jgi:hypothetical protein
MTTLKRLSTLTTVALITILSAGTADAGIRYVDVGSADPAPPYTNWATAARVIQDAVDAAEAGDEIVVTNGLYATGGRAVGTNLLVNRVAVDKPLTLRSVNGPEVTMIQGYQVPGTTNGDGAIRCVYLADDARLLGFTLAGGATHVLHQGEGEDGGGGVSCEASAQVINCLLVGNSAGFGGGAVSGILSNCVLMGNSSEGSGGGAWASTLHNCRVSGNSASGGGGAAWGELNNCIVSSNSAAYTGGGAVGGVLNNCTLTYNSAGAMAGGVDGGFSPAQLNNCIIYFNNAPVAAHQNYNYSILNYCCTTPMPTDDNGVGNITNAPLFVDAAAGNYRLRSDSPCINAGNNACVTSLTDLDGRPRIFGGTVDIGAYEYQLAPGSWTQKSDMPAPASAAGSCVMDRILYVIGGHDSKAGTNALRSVWTYDPRVDLWSTNRSPMPAGRKLLCAVAMDGLIYVVGGTGPGWPGAFVLPVAVYSPQSDTWTNGAPMPTGRGALAVCAVDGTIYAIGGALSTSTQTAAVEAYDPKSNQWTVKRPMPEARSFVTVSAVNGLIYAFHGNDVFVYDTKTNTWATKGSHFAPYSWGLMSAEVDGIIYLFGGMTQDWSDGNDFTMAYDPTQDRFTSRRRMLRKRITSACAVIAGKVYLAGGASKEPVVNPDPIFYTSLDVFDPQGGVMPQILSLTCEGTNRVRLSWQGEVGQRYGVESRPNSANGSWRFCTGGNAVVATNEVVEATCIVPGGTSSFFRVQER